MLFNDLSIEASRRAHELLGQPEHQLVGRWADIEILNGIVHTTLWLESDVIWSGIARQDDSGLAILQKLYPQIELSVQPVESGVHY